MTTLIYNAADQLVEKQSPDGVRKYVYDGQKLLMETREDNTTELVYDSVLNDEYGELTSRYHDATSGTDYYQYDGLGSTETMSDEAQADVDVYRYKAFGEIAQQFGTADNPFTFVGRQGYAYYPELELYFAGMSGGGQAARAGEESHAGRMLDPKTGQWISRDEMRDKEENLYDYVGNNPVNVVDPNGNQPPVEQDDERNRLQIRIAMEATGKFPWGRQTKCYDCHPDREQETVPDLSGLFHSTSGNTGDFSAEQVAARLEREARKRQGEAKWQEIVEALAAKETGGDLAQATSILDQYVKTLAFFRKNPQLGKNEGGWPFWHYSPPPEFRPQRAEISDSLGEYDISAAREEALGDLLEYFRGDVSQTEVDPNRWTGFGVG